MYVPQTGKVANVRFFVAVSALTPARGLGPFLPIEHISKEPIMTRQLLFILQTWFADRRDDERGVTAVEYGLMVAFIAGAIIVGAGALGGGLNALFQSAADFVTGVTF